MNRTLFLAQRLSAMAMAPLVLVHLGLIIWAVRGGLSAEEILARTHGSFLWALFYGTFVLAACIHAPIGLMNILTEWTRLSRSASALVAIIICILLLASGLRAVWAVVA